MADTRPGSQAVERALAVLDCFAGCPDLTLGEVAARTRMPVGTTHRIMAALVRGGYLEHIERGTYQVGPRVAGLLPSRSVADEIAPHLYLLSAAIKITATFGVANNGEVATLVRARPPVRYCTAQITADREPLHATAMGKVLLAFGADGIAPARARGALEAYTEHTRTKPAELLADLEQARRSGFAVSDEELREGVRAVAVPVFGLHRTPVGAIGIQALPHRMTDELVRSLVLPMTRLAAEIGHRLADKDPIQR